MIIPHLFPPVTHAVEEPPATYFILHPLSSLTLLTTTLGAFGGVETFRSFVLPSPPFFEAIRLEFEARVLLLARAFVRPRDKVEFKVLGEGTTGFWKWGCLNSGETPFRAEERVGRVVVQVREGFNRLAIDRLDVWCPLREIL